MTSEALLAQANWVRRLAASLVASGEADDFAQEALRSALEEPPLVASTASLRAWLRSVMRNLVRVDRRGRSTRAWHEERAAKREAIESDAGERTELQERLARAVHALAEPYRSAIVLRYFDELAPREIAERQNISYDTARQRLSRGLAMLRAELDRDYEGGRDAWSAVCIAMAKKSSLASTSTALATGGAIVSAKSLIGVAALVVIAATSFWWLQRSASTVELEAGSHAAEPALAALPKRDEPTKTNVAAQSPTERAPVLTAADSNKFHRAIDRDRDLHGFVIDPSGKPIVGAKLEVLRNEFCETSMLDLEHRFDRTSVARDVTDEYGEFAFRLPVGRAFDLEASAVGFAKRLVSHCHAGERVVVTVQRGATLVGRVTRSSDGSAVADASIDLIARSSDFVGPSVDVPRTRTDAEGYYRFDGLVAGTFALGVTASKEAGKRGIEVELREAQETRRDVTLDAGFTLHGRVVDDETGAGIPDAEVGESWALLRHVLSDTNGDFVLEGVSFDDISARARGYGRVAHSTRKPDGSRSDTIEFRLRRARVAEGRVVNADGAPIEDVYVAATAYGDSPGQDSNDQIDWRSTHSAADGRFHLDELRPDVAHTLLVKKDGFATASYEFPLRERDTTALDLGDLVLHEGATIRGRALDQNAKGLAARVVQLAGRNADHDVWQSGNHARSVLGARMTRTDDLGRFAFADVAQGSYDVAILRDDSSAATSQRVEVNWGASTENVELVFASSLSIQGRLVGPRGEPVAGSILFERVDGNRKHLRRERAAADGSFTLSDLEAGDYRLEVTPSASSDSSGDAAPFAVSVAEPVKAGSADVVVRVPRSQRLNGRVLDRLGAPVVKASVVAQVWTTRLHAVQSTTTDSDGRFELWLAGDQRWTVIASPPADEDVAASGADDSESAAKQAHLENIAPGGADVELRLP